MLSAIGFGYICVHTAFGKGPNNKIFLEALFIGASLYNKVLLGKKWR